MLKLNRGIRILEELVIWAVALESMYHELSCGKVIVANDLPNSVGVITGL